MSALLDRWMPEVDEREYHEVDVGADPAHVYDFLRQTDLASSRLVRALFALRGMRRRGVTIDGLIRFGFVLLDEVTGEEIVLGLVGRPWQVRGGIVRVTPETFDDDHGSVARAVWNFRAERIEQGTRLSTETRVRCSDEAGRRRFRRYWRVVGPFSGVIRSRMLRTIARAASMPPARPR